MNQNQQDFIRHIARVTAKYHEQIVVVDVEDTSLNAAGMTTIRGDFGNTYTHGGWAQVTSKTVPVTQLTEIIAVLDNGEQVHAKG